MPPATAELLLAEIKNPRDREQARRIDAAVERLRASIATRFEWHSALICSAADPMDMVRALKPVLDPYDRPELPPLYVRVAQFAIRRRAEVARRAAESRAPKH